MLLPLLLLPWAWGALAASPPLPPGTVPLRVLLTSRFQGASSAHIQVKALLGDLETHSLACGTCEIRFLQPWARQGLTPKQWQDLELVIHRSLADFLLTVTRIAQQQGIGYPFVTQGSLGCELHPNGTSRGFYDAAGNGEDVVSFDVDTGTWVARSRDKRALYARDLLNWDKSASTRLQFFFRITCIYLLNTFVQHGRESLERQERPVAVVFARAPPPAGTPAPVLLVCRVTGFYPRPVRVAWLQDGEEVVPGGWLNSSGILPNADLTYQLRSSLGVEPGAGHSYTCRVQHSSLGGQSLLIPWEQSRPWGPGLAVGITLGVLAVAAVAVVLWRRRRRGCQDVRPGESRASEGGTGPGVGIGPSPGDMELRAGSVPGSRAEGPEGRTGSGPWEIGARGGGWDSPPSGTFGARWTLGGAVGSLGSRSRREPALACAVQYTLQGGAAQRASPGL
ncbi:antigen-presenting glycoprotein CD1d-like [Mauremys reevesii]|uniref:antigen-presenting glycoprotein CD1d-like n=1 Tax=Mauremys reevesii TaxID=260615 RepID=UPI00193F807E|nr:antigen-presenting glycoprotein CD1d-like [Mauremys reevesii]